MLRIYARVLTVVLAVVAIAAAVRIPGWACSIWARRSSSPTRAFGRGHRECPKGRGSNGLFLLAFGVAGGAHHGCPRVPIRREGLGSGAGARRLRRVDDGMRGVVAL
jgi:hypothetical protein